MPVITVSRMYGSGGSEIASRLARALDWPLFDNAFIDAVAERSGLTRAEVSAREERVPPLVERVAAALSLGTPEAMPAIADGPMTGSDEQINAIESRIIEEAAQNGPAVFVGRGAQCLLAERQDALHVFCYAPRRFLREQAAKRLQVSPAEAERMVIDTNKQREQYVRRNFRRDWLSPENYHLMIDTSWLGLDAASEMIVEMARKRFA